MGTRAVALPLAAGNTTVLKGSELSPKCFWAIGDAFRQAGLPDGCLNVLYSQPSDAPKVTTALIAHPATRKLSFTGSTEIGRKIAQIAATYIKPVILELGGKASIVVLDDADVEKAALGAVIGSFMHVCLPFPGNEYPTTNSDTRRVKSACAQKGSSYTGTSLISSARP